MTAPDPDSIERLNAAARELVKHLNEAQKREVQTLAHLVGTEKPVVVGVQHAT